MRRRASWDEELVPSAHPRPESIHHCLELLCDALHSIVVSLSVADLAERKFWDAYQQRYQEVLRATSTLHAPWYVVPADSKTHRNLLVANVVLETLQKLKLKFPDAKPELSKLKFD